MTEHEWRTSTHPVAMLTFLRGKVSDRKLRLFACGCCRQILPLFVVGGHEAHTAINATELYAGEKCDGQDFVAASGLSVEQCKSFLRSELTVSNLRAIQALVILAQESDNWCDIARWVAEYATDAGRAAIGNLTTDPDRTVDNGTQCSIARDVFGDPFRPVAADPSWLTSTVTALAAGIYADRAFDRLPILADALEEAGCDYADVLAHCRGAGPHVRGCWVVDAVLGKV